MKTGIAQGTLGPIVNGHRTPGHGFYEKLLECHPDLSITWIITGHGEMFLPDTNALKQKIDLLENLNEFLKKNHSR
ncbi:MAG: hypothetical protein K9J17_15440 [Flavobacteriales bacterium]|nr:hypothetical protein [Flavobacteriales bacterium]